MAVNDQCIVHNMAITFFLPIIIDTFQRVFILGCKKIAFKTIVFCINHPLPNLLQRVVFESFNINIKPRMWEYHNINFGVGGVKKNLRMPIGKPLNLREKQSVTAPSKRIVMN